MGSLAWLVGLVFFVGASSFGAAEAVLGEVPLVVCANDIDAQLASGLFSLLEDANVSYVLSSPANLDVSHPVLLFLGGHRAPGGVGEFVRGILSAGERELLLSSADASYFFSHDDFFVSGQRVLVAAGFDRFGTQAAWERHAADILAAVSRAPERSFAASGEELVLGVSDFYFADVILGKANSGFVQKDDPRFNHVFLIVNLSVSNYGDGVIEYATRDFRVESDGRSFGRSVVRYLPGTLRGKHLGPGETVSGYVVFEVPEGMVGFTLTYACPLHPRCERSVPLS